MKTLRIILPLVLIGLLGVAWFEPTRTVRGWIRQEPFFQGRSASYWGSVAAGEEPLARAAAMDHLESGKLDAMPVLLHMLTADRPETRWTAGDLIGKIGPPAAETATGPLLERLEDPDPFVRRVAGQALAACKANRPEVIAALVAKLKGAEPEVALRPLSLFGAAAKSAVPDLIAIAQNTEQAPARRWEAMRTLGKIGPDSREAIPILIRGLTESEDKIREHSAESLGEIGATEAVPNLVAVLGDPSVRVRRDAARSLGQLAPASKSAAADIEKLLTDKEEMVRDAARAALQRIDPERRLPN